MKAFVLHDGEDSKRTDEMHRFMEDWISRKGHDWDGSSTGVSMWCSAVPGDAFVIGRDGGMRVLPKDEPVTINRWTFPFVYMAMLTIERDNGAHHLNRIMGPGAVELRFFTMPHAYGVEKLAEADEALGRLAENRENFEAFVIGDQDTQFKIMERNEGLETAHSLLNDWFNQADGLWANMEKTDG